MSARYFTAAPSHYIGLVDSKKSLLTVCSLKHRSDRISLPNSSFWTIYLYRHSLTAAPPSAKLTSFENVDTTKGSALGNTDLEKPEIKKLAVFSSGRGSNMKAIHEACVQGLTNGKIVVLVTDKPACEATSYARMKEIPILVFPKTRAGHGLCLDELISLLRNFGTDFILLAGYLKLLPPELIRAYPRAILNIHPSLLPAFGGKGYYGMKVHEAVISSGVRYSGATVHFVDEQYDRGPILSQRVVPVYANDTAENLAQRVLQEEHKLYLDVTSAICEDRVMWRNDGVPVIQDREF